MFYASTFLLMSCNFQF